MRDLRVATLVLVLAGLLVACRRGPDAETRRHTATVAEALRPGFFAAALRHLGGAHFHGTARFQATPEGGAADAVTTTTDLWLDRQGNYRMRETNDRDGGREVVRYGRELDVALRYGKMIRRPAEEPEPTRLLEEAVGAPGAAWEVIAPASLIERVGEEAVEGARATRYRIKMGTSAGSPSSADAIGLRAWRGTVTVSALDGRVSIDDATGALLQADLQTTFTAKQGGRTMRGEIEVHTALSDVGRAAAIERPPAQDLALRQRIVPEQRELLQGLAAGPSSVHATPGKEKRP
jgi:hypothetical protein